MEIKGNVLVVDDDALVRMNYADLLEDSGYGVSEAESCIQGLNAVQSREFDLIICDHDLGDGKGVEIIQAIIQQGKTTPFIYLSGARNVVLDQVREMPVVRSVMAKPVSEADILSAVEEHICTVLEDTYPKLIGDDERSQLLSTFTFNPPEE